jgi:hypothetical protein
VASALGAGFFAGLIFLSLTKPARPPTAADGPAANPSTLGNVEANGVPPTPPSLSSSNGQPQSPNLQQPSARDIDVDAEIESAGRLFSQGNYTGVIEAMKPLAKQFPKRSDVHRFLAHSYGKLALSDPSFARDALLETQAWLGLDATAAQDATVKQRVRTAATIDDTMELALAILENQMGPGGADILFDFAFNSDQKTETFRRLASRARNILEKPAVYNNASEALRIAYALRGSPQSQTCEQRHELLTTARTYCDDRCVEPLRALQRTTGCGEKNQKDCWPCLRKDRKLIDALEAASKRPRLH